MLIGGRYETIRELGRGGGFGKTYLAEDTYRRGNPKCVIKKIQPSSKLPTVLQKAREVFETEARALYELGSYDQIPTLFEHLEQNSEFYFVQELVDGHDLRQAFTLGDRWDEKTLVSLLREILEILTVVHQHQVIHRDVKPQNLIRRWRDKKLVLIDFSGVKAIRSLTLTAQGEAIIPQPIGTPGYMPKEQMEGNPLPSSDLYAVGMMAIQALTGYSPNQLPRNPKTQEVEWHDQAQVSPELVAILDRMVQINPAKRYSSAQEVLEVLPSPIAKVSTELDEWLEVPKSLTYQMIIEPTFRIARPFSEGLAAVVVEDRVGYINPMGKFVIPPELEFDLVSSFRPGAYQFSEDRAPVAIAHRWGYIDRTGKFSIKPQFHSAEMFAQGLARVELDHLYGYINLAGDFVIHPQFESAAPVFHEDLAGVEIDHSYGYIDRTGKVVIAPRFDSADVFAEGLARVTIDSKYGFIDKAGRLVIPANFDVAHSFSEGLARVRIDGKYGYIDPIGDIVILPIFDDTFSYTEGLALVRNQEQYGYINVFGKMVIPLQFEDAYPFSEGVAAVRINQRWGYINLQGEFVVEPQFEDAGSFYYGRAAVKVGSLWGYLGT